MAVIEQHHGVARGVERLGVGGQTVVAGRAEPVGHDDAGRRGGGMRWRVEIGGELLAVGRNADVLAVRCGHGTARYAVTCGQTGVST